MARLGLGANNYTAIEALSGEMGWSRYQERIAKMKTNYKIKLEEVCQGNEDTWIAFVYRMTSQEWVKEVNRIDRKYSLREFYQEEGKRKKVGRAICMYGQREWERGIEKKTTLRFYRNKKEPIKEDFYDGSYEGKLLFRARTGSLELNGRTYRWNGGRENCESCGRGVKETIEHFLIECDRYQAERDKFMREMQALLGQEKWQEVKSLEDGGIAVVLGFQSGDVVVDSKNRAIAEATKVFLRAAWKIRVVS